MLTPKQKAFKYLKDNVNLLLGCSHCKKELEIAFDIIINGFIDDFKKLAKHQSSVGSPKPCGYFISDDDFDKLTKKAFSKTKKSSNNDFNKDFTSKICKCGHRLGKHTMGDYCKICKKQCNNW